MPGSIDPLYCRVGKFGSILVTAANTSSAGGGTIATDIFLAFTADATNGSYIKRIEWVPVATAPTTTTATVGRVFVSTQASGATTSANTYLLREIALLAIAADNTATIVNPFFVAADFILPATYTILCTNHAAPAANSNWRLNVICGDF